MLLDSIGDLPVTGKDEAALVYEGFRQLENRYAERNGHYELIDAFYVGSQWEDLEGKTEAQVKNSEAILLTLNYARVAVFWHLSFLCGKPPRVDVPQPALTDPSARKRERALRWIVHHKDFRRAHRRVELSANKYGAGVLQVLWAPRKKQPVKAKDEGIKHYTKMPFRFRAIDPRDFYPRYRTHDEPNDFLYVIRRDRERDIKDLELKYDVVLEPTTDRDTCDLLEYWDEEDYVLVALTLTKDPRYNKDNSTVTILEKHKNRAGVIPFFVLQNREDNPAEDPTYFGSIGEVEQVMPLNRHLNFIFSAVATEIGTRVHPPVVYKSEGDPQQETTEIRIGAGEVIHLGAEESLEPVEWKGVPDVVREHRDATMSVLRDVAGLPRTSFGSSGAASGIGMRMAYSALEQVLNLKIPLREEWLEATFGHCLEALETYLTPSTLLMISHRSGEGVEQDVLNKDDVTGTSACRVKFLDILPKSAIEWGQHVSYLYKLELISHRTALELMSDIPDPDTELDRIRKEARDEELNPEKAMMLKNMEREQRQQAQQAQQQPPPGAPQPGAAGPPGMGVGMPGGLPGMPGGMAMPGMAGLGSNQMMAPPPVPTMPSTPGGPMGAGQATPFMPRGPGPNFGQVFPGRPGVNPGPRPEGQ